jgi:hypothetical protein
VTSNIRPPPDYEIGPVAILFGKACVDGSGGRVCGLRGLRGFRLGALLKVATIIV